MESDSPYVASSSKLVAASALDLLLIEIVPLAQNVVNETLRAKQRGLTVTTTSSGQDATTSTSDSNGGQSRQSSVTKRGSKSGGIVADEYNDDIYFRIEGYGYRVGLGLSHIFTKERPWFKDQLDVMKFVCKELWDILYKKQIDNLKTNHRGTYVLIDNSFKYCQRMGTAYGDLETLRRATPYLWFPAGVIRGVLSALGIEATVTFDAVQLPAISFNIQTGGT